MGTDIHSETESILYTFDIIDNTLLDYITSIDTLFTHESILEFILETKIELLLLPELSLNYLMEMRLMDSVNYEIFDSYITITDKEYEDEYNIIKPIILDILATKEILNKNIIDGLNDYILDNGYEFTKLVDLSVKCMVDLYIASKIVVSTRLTFVI